MNTVIKSIKNFLVRTEEERDQLNWYDGFMDGAYFILTIIILVTLIAYVIGFLVV